MSSSSITAGVRRPLDGSAFMANHDFAGLCESDTPMQWLPSVTHDHAAATSLTRMLQVMKDIRRASTHDTLAGDGREALYPIGRASPAATLNARLGAAVIGYQQAPQLHFPFHTLHPLIHIFYEGTRASGLHIPFNAMDLCELGRSPQIAQLRAQLSARIHEPASIEAASRFTAGYAKHRRRCQRFIEEAIHARARVKLINLAAGLRWEPHLENCPYPHPMDYDACVDALLPTLTGMHDARERLLRRVRRRYAGELIAYLWKLSFAWYLGPMLSVTLVFDGSRGEHPAHIGDEVELWWIEDKKLRLGGAARTLGADFLINDARTDCFPAHGAERIELVTRDWVDRLTRTERVMALQLPNRAKKMSASIF